MEMSALIAKALGAFIVIVGLALYFNRKNLTTIYNLAKNKEYIFFSGIFNLIVGVLIVLNHNIWSADWRLIVTLMGWIGVVKGFMRLFKPDWVRSNVLRFKNNKDLVNLIFVLMLALGIYLLYVGFTTPFGSFF